MNTDSHHQGGFSMIELMVVVAIISILAAIAIPSYMGIQKKAARSEAKAKLEAIALSLEGYMAENNDYGSDRPYTYVCGPGCVAPAGFGHSGGIGAIANMGNNLLYNYQIIVTQTPAPAFTVIATPRTGGRVAGDINIWLQSNGVKGPVGAGW